MTRSYDGSVLFNGTHCPICGANVERGRADDGRIMLTCPADDHTFGRLEHTDSTSEESV